MAKRLGVDTRISRQLLLTGAMCAMKLGRFEEAERIILGVKAFRDDVPHPCTALAGVFLYQGRMQDAAAELEQVLAAFPNHQLGKALLGLIYRETGRREWKQLSQEVIDDGRDEWAIKLASETLGCDPPVAQPTGTPSDHGDSRENARLRVTSPTAYA